MHNFTQRAIVFVLYPVFVCVLINLIEACDDAPVSEKPTQGNPHQLLVDTILHHSNRSFAQFEKGGMRFYYEPDEFFNKNIQQLAADAIQSKNECLKLLGVPNPKYQLQVIYFNNRQKLRPYVNFSPKGIALPAAYTLLIATNDSLRAYHTHEIMHIISIQHFGSYPVEPSAWIREGISVYADNPCNGYSIQAIGAYLYYTNRLPTLDSLIHQFNALPDMIAYMSAGSLTSFIADRYGMKSIEKLWNLGINGLHSVVGKTEEELENEYQSYLREKFPRQPDIDWELIEAKGCG